MTKSGKDGYGFTIIELLVVVVIIGILAAITAVGYIGFQNKAVAATLESDLDNGSKQLKLFQITNKNYPTLVDDCPNPGVDNICLKFSFGNTLVSYVPDNVSRPRTFSLTIENIGKDLKYTITNATTPTEVIDIICPIGFIIVPGSDTYGTSDFCVMKYEAKILGNDNGDQAYNSSFIPDSRNSGTPWVNISQTNAIAEAQTYPNCVDCHLITEAEWMTIAQNVLSVPGNWSNGLVGSGFIYSGHNDNAPANSLAVTNTADGYSDTGNVSPSNQKRSLNLNNGEVIWDMAGNVYEWTSSQVSEGKPGLTSGPCDWCQWDNPYLTAGVLTVNPFPANTGITGASTWNSTNGIGQLFSYVDDPNLRGFLRGGGLIDFNRAGVLSLLLAFSPSYAGPPVGFRISGPGQ